MTRWMLCASFVLAAISLSTPASAQYRFDRRIDPTQCYWRDVCDYGGRAVRYHRWHRYSLHCRWVEVEAMGAKGVAITRRERQCPLRVRG